MSDKHHVKLNSTDLTAQGGTISGSVDLHTMEVKTTEKIVSDTTLGSTRSIKLAGGAEVIVSFAADGKIAGVQGFRARMTIINDHHLVLKGSLTPGERA